MKKLITLILAVGFALLLTSCNANTLNTTPDENGVIQTPVRVGREGAMQASLARFFTLEEAIEEACLIADVTITSWLSEDLDDRVTFFAAKANNIFKGELVEEFVLMQAGSSESTFADYPLYKVGSRMILFLRSDKELEYDDLDYVRYENTFWPVGIYITDLHIEEIDNTLFLIDRFGPLTESLRNPAIAAFSEPIMPEKSIIEAVIAQRNISDPVLANNAGRAEHVFFYDEIAQLIGEAASI